MTAAGGTAEAVPFQIKHARGVFRRLWSRV